MLFYRDMSFAETSIVMFRRPWLFRYQPAVCPRSPTPAPSFPALSGQISTLSSSLLLRLLLLSPPLSLPVPPMSLICSSVHIDWLVNTRGSLSADIAIRTGARRLSGVP
eukprot:166957-Hanusia_phi.AAC.1